VLRLQLAGTDLWSVFEAAVDRVAHDLDTNPTRINYATRRRVLACWHMPETDWAELCADIPKLGRMMARTGGPAVGSVLVWARATQSEHIHSPVLTDMRRAGQATSPVSNQVAQLLTPASRKGGRLELLRRLDRYATHLADRCDTVRTAPFH